MTEYEITNNRITEAKRIAELEKENADLKEEINKIAFTRGNIEAENAGLKADNDARKFAIAMSEKVEKQLREEIAELKEKLNFSTQYYQGEKAKEQLTKAKEIIKNLIDYPKRFGQASGKYHHECELAEQFLNSEVEK